MANARGGGGGGGRKKVGKRRCEMGRSCPYMKEYQHQLEFSHDDDGDAEADADGGNNGPFQPFGGGGRSLVSGTDRSTVGAWATSSSSSSSAKRGSKSSKEAMSAAALARAPAASSSSASTARFAASSHERIRGVTSKKRSAASSKGWVSKKRPASSPMPSLDDSERQRPREKSSGGEGDDIIVVDKNGNEKSVENPKLFTPRADGSQRSNTINAALVASDVSPVDLITPERDSKKNAASQHSGTARGGERSVDHLPAANDAVNLCDSDSDSDDVVICDGDGDTSTNANQAATRNRRDASAHHRGTARQRRPFDHIVRAANNTSAEGRHATQSRMQNPDPFRQHFGNGGGITADAMSPFGGATSAVAAAAGFGILPTSFGGPPPVSAQSQLQAQQMEAAARSRARAEEQRQLKLAIAASNREVLHEQDREYQESLEQDRRKEREKREEEETRQRAEEGNKLEEERAAREEKREREKQKAKALDGLGDEPPGDDPDVATVAFRMPAKCKDRRVVRRFRRNDNAGQLVRFLQAKCAEKLGEVEKWTLREVMGGGKIGERDSRNNDGLEKTVEDLGLYPRGVVVVRDEGC